MKCANNLTKLFVDIKYYKFLLFFFLTFFSFGFCQQERENLQIRNFYYKLKYQADSLDNIKYEEVFQLSVNGDYSIFTDIVNKKADSMEVDIRESQQKNKPLVYSFRGVPKAKFTFYVKKDLKNKILEFYEKIGAKHFYYKEDANMLWKLHPETKIISNHNCQRATIRKYGRNFIAWFAKDIPINDGPYKFSGLPGLIIELYDEKDSYHFQLINYDKRNDNISYDVPVYRTKKQVITDKESFVEGKKNYEQSTVERLKNSFLSDALTEDKVREIRERIKKKNNPIELNL